MPFRVVLRFCEAVCQNDLSSLFGPYHREALARCYGHACMYESQAPRGPSMPSSSEDLHICRQWQLFQRECVSMYSVLVKQYTNYKVQLQLWVAQVLPMMCSLSVTAACLACCVALVWYTLFLPLWRQVKTTSRLPYRTVLPHMLQSLIIPTVCSHPANFAHAITVTWTMSALKLSPAAGWLV